MSGARTACASVIVLNCYVTGPLFDDAGVAGQRSRLVLWLVLTIAAGKALHPFDVIGQQRQKLDQDTASTRKSRVEKYIHVILLVHVHFNNHRVYSCKSCDNHKQVNQIVTGLNLLL